MVLLAYHFSQAHTVSETTHETGVSHTAVADAHRVFRRAICNYMKWYTEKMQLGGPGKVEAETQNKPSKLGEAPKDCLALKKTFGQLVWFLRKVFSSLGTCLKLQVVLVDESFVTKRKHNKGGFIGRTTRGHVTTIFAAVEMTTNEDGTHTETGRAVVEVVPNKEAGTLARIMKQYIKPGSTVYTDGASMYSWLDKFPETWRHLSVLHAKGQFSKKGPPSTETTWESLCGGCGSCALRMSHGVGMRSGI